MNITVREYESEDAHAAAEIWNEVVRDGVAFPQKNEMNDREADEFSAHRATPALPVMKAAGYTDSTYSTLTISADAVI